MVDFISFFVPACYFFALVATVALPAIGVGLGQGVVGKTVADAVDLQPAARILIRNRVFVLGIALTEGVAIFATVIGLLIVLGKSVPTTMGQAFGFLGVFLAMAIPATAIGFLTSLPVKATLFAVARQPLFASRIANLFLLVVSFAQTPVVFGFLVSLVILLQLDPSISFIEGIKFISSGFALGVGSIGPAIGISLLGSQACKSLGTNKDSYKSVFSFTLISAAIIETPVLFALVTSLFLLFSSLPEQTESMFVAAAAALMSSVPTIAVGISTGRTARSACEQIAIHPEQYSALLRMSLICEALIDANAIYGLIVSVMLLFVFV